MRVNAFETHQEICDRLATLVASVTGIPAASVARNSMIWDQFPTSANRWQHPAVTSFVDGVHSEFDVYLTEEEWEQPTLEGLANVIRAKQDNPALSIADRAAARSARREGMMIVLACLAIALLAMYFSRSGR